MLGRLPALHRGAAWRLAAHDVPAHLASPGALTLAVQGHTVYRDPADLDAAESVARVLATILPPPTEADEDGVRLARGHEDEIADLADEYAEAGRIAQEVYDRGQAERDQPLPDPEPWTREERACPAWWRRRLRRSAKRAQCWFDAALRLPRPASPFVSSFSLSAYRERQAAARAWAASQEVAFADGSAVPLPEVQARGRTARRAQLYAVVKGMEHHAEENGYDAFFVTLTLPGEFHPFTSGPRASDGTYPQGRPNEGWNPACGPVAQAQELQRRWALLRARIAKHRDLRSYFGILVPEPHQDGTPHFHAMTWLPRTFLRNGRTRRTEHLLRRLLRDVAPRREGRLDVIRKAGPGTASPASYVMKYVLKSLDDEDTLADQGDAGERHRAWASARGLRRMRLVGVHGSLRVWQRLWTSGNDEELPARARAARTAMRRSATAGERAVTFPADSPERAAARREQATAAADALLLIGGLPGGDGRLRLGYDETVTAYGRPTRKAMRIVDPDTDETMSLRRQEAVLRRVEAVPEPTPEAADPKPVTVVAIGPRAGAAPRPALPAPPPAVPIRLLQGVVGTLPPASGPPPPPMPGRRRPMMTMDALEVMAA